MSSIRVAALGPSVLLLAALSSGLLLTTCHDSRSVAAEAAKLIDAPLADHRSELLAIAYKAASAMPIDPHVKNRSRAQAAVVGACIELDQPQLALTYLASIQNWLRGLCYADLAFDRARRGRPEGVEGWLDRAAEIADGLRSDPSFQEWRQDRIRVRIAQTWLLLGKESRAAELTANVVDSEDGKLEKVRATRLPADSFDAQLAAIDAVLASGSLDRLRTALETCAELHDRFYGEPERRALLEARVRTGYRKLPVDIRLDLLLELARHALAHEDRDKARELIAAAERIIDESQWPADVQVPRRARVAVLRHRAGESETARRQLESALATFAAERQRVFDIDRADTLIPIAEAYHAMGDRSAALATYARALEESVGNPNSWPRADDLVAICCSLAKLGLAPDAALRARITAICDGLGDPW
jgi:tetratricopeptide (TPR) repeat protein